MVVHAAEKCFVNRDRHQEDHMACIDHRWLASINEVDMKTRHSLLSGVLLDSNDMVHGHVCNTTIATHFREGSVSGDVGRRGIIGRSEAHATMAPFFRRSSDHKATSNTNALNFRPRAHHNCNVTSSSTEGTEFLHTYTAAVVLFTTERSLIQRWSSQNYSPKMQSNAPTRMLAQIRERLCA